jgi:hypothetical protein
MKKHNTTTVNNRFNSTLKTDQPIFQVGPSFDFATIAEALATAYLEVNTDETIILELEPGHAYTWAGTIASSHSYAVKTLGGITQLSTSTFKPLAPETVLDFTDASLSVFGYDGVMNKRSLSIRNLYVTGTVSEIPWGWDVEIRNSTINLAEFTIDTITSTADKYHGTTLHIFNSYFYKSNITVNNKGASTNPTSVAFYDSYVYLLTDNIVGAYQSWGLGFYGCDITCFLGATGNCINIEGVAGETGFLILVQYSTITIWSTTQNNQKLVNIVNSVGAEDGQFELKNTIWRKYGNKTWNFGLSFIQTPSYVPLITGFETLPLDHISGVNPLPPGTAIQDTMNVDGLGATNSTRTWNGTSWLPHQVETLAALPAAGPLNTDPQAGDMYFDTAQGNKPYFYSPNVGVPGWYDGAGVIHP